MHLVQLFKDVWRAKKWWDKFRIWFMPTGWRPADVAARYPLVVIEDAYVKYQPKLPTSLQLWSWTQLIFTFVSMMYLFNSLTEIGFPGMIYYAAFLFFSIFSFSMLMDKSQYAWIVEVIKSLVGITIIALTGDWFLLDTILPFGQYFVAGYFVVSSLVVIYFNLYELKSDCQLQVA